MSFPSESARPPVEYASVRSLVAATPEQCYAVASDIASYPEWAHAIIAVEIVDLDQLGRVATARFVAEAIGRRTSYVLRYDYSQAPHRLAWSQESGDITSRVDGAYSFAAAADHPDATDVGYELSIELAVPLPGFVKRRAEAKIVEAALGKFRLRTESVYPDIS